MKRPTRRAFLTTSLAVVLLATTVGAADARLSARTSDRATVINMIRQEARNMGVSVPSHLRLPTQNPISIQTQRAIKAPAASSDYAGDLTFEYGIHPDLLWDARINTVSGCIFCVVC